MKLKEYREEIDRIDRELVGLLEKRLDVASEIGKEKARTGKPVLDEAREKDKIRAIEEMAREETRPYISSVIREVIAASRKYQEDHRFSYGLLGHPLGHSFSPQVHSLFGRYDFGLFDVEPDMLEEFLRNGHFKGLSVTMPYKKAVMERCGSVSVTAEEADSVNTIVKDDEGILHGHNTDYHGLRYLMESEGIDPAGEKALVLGDGGVAGTVRKVLRDLGASDVITISRRSGDNNYENIDKHADAGIIVNATPLGMYPENGDCAIDLHMFENCRGVVDLIYNPLKTELILTAEDMGIRAAGGIKMLVAQAARACELFTGEPVNPEKIEEACDSILKMSENISLIGMPGCGKTSIGGILAKLTGKKFTDLDEVIIERTGRSPEEIINDLGEEAFRNTETEILEDVSKTGGQVIAAGGGAVTREANSHLLRQNGRVVYIVRALEELSTKGRPLSEKVGTTKLFEERRAMYEDWSDMAFDNSGMKADEAAGKIAKMLKY